VSSLGAYLKSYREKKGISLQKIQEDTKIRMKYLEAIEEDRLEILPGEVYTRGFLKAYAAAVGLTEDDVIARYENLIRSHGNLEAENDATANEPSIITATKVPIRSEKRPLFQTNARIYIYGIGVMLVLAVIFVPLILSQRKQAVISTADTVDASDASASAISSTDADEDNAAITDETVSTNSEAKTIALAIHAECWVDVRVDGALVEQRILHPGEKPQWNGKKIRIVLGNAGGVTLFEDGENKGIPGSNGQRLELEFSVQ
jgi:cytoskeletal protein RodZ